jgi:hypothetical protein
LAQRLDQLRPADFGIPSIVFEIAVCLKIKHLVVRFALDRKRNTLIEVGVAMGSGTELRFICRAPPDGTVPKKRFMFEGREFFWYRTPRQRLGFCYYFAREFRRRVYVIR